MQSYEKSGYTKINAAIRESKPLDRPIPFVQCVHPEYEAFHNGLSGFDKKAFKRFRRHTPC